MISTPVTYREAYALYRQQMFGVLPAGYEWRLVINEWSEPTHYDAAYLWASDEGLRGVVGKRKQKREMEAQGWRLVA